MAKGCKKAKAPKEVKKAAAAVPVRDTKKEIKKAKKAAKKEMKRKDKIERKAYEKAIKKANSDKLLTILALLLTSAATVLNLLLDKREKEKELESKDKEDTSVSK